MKTHPFVCRFQVSDFGTGAVQTSVDRAELKNRSTCKDFGGPLKRYQDWPIIASSRTQGFGEASLTVKPRHLQQLLL